MLALLRLAQLVVVDPAPAMAGEVAAGLDHGAGRDRVAPPRLGPGVDRERQVPVGAQTEDTHHAGPRPRLVKRPADVGQRPAGVVAAGGFREAAPLRSVASHPPPAP